ncbi:unnamed protein product, partial [Ectocarpus fasciculatus]
MLAPSSERHHAAVGSDGTTAQSGMRCMYVVHISLAASPSQQKKNISFAADWHQSEPVRQPDVVVIVLLLICLHLASCGHAPGAASQLSQRTSIPMVSWRKPAAF